MSKLSRKERVLAACSVAGGIYATYNLDGTAKEYGNWREGVVGEIERVVFKEEVNNLINGFRY